MKLGLLCSHRKGVSLIDLERKTVSSNLLGVVADSSDFLPCCCTRWASLGFLMAFVGELPWADPCGSRHVTFSGAVFGVPRKADQPFALPVLEEGRASCSQFWDSPWRWWACVFRTRVQKQRRQRLTMKWIYSHWPGFFWLIWIAKIKRKKKTDNTKCWQKHRTTKLSLDGNEKNYKVAWLPWETVWQDLG